jgi:hypothetical protein
MRKSADEQFVGTHKKCSISKRVIQNHIYVI